MVKTRTIVKNCPKCSLRVAVASKKCKCGYSFVIAKATPPIKPAPRSQPSVYADERRRTSRVRREAPKYYNSQEFEKEKKKKKKKEKRVTVQGRRKSTQGEPNEDKTKESITAKANRRRQRKDDDHSDVDLCAKLSVERQHIANLILSELNRKMGAVVWQPT